MEAAENMSGIDIAIAHHYPGFLLDVKATLPERGITAIFGRSGSGKTTLINAFAGALKPQRGRISVGDTVFVDTALGIYLPPHRRRIGYVFQEARLFPHMSVRSNLLYGSKRAAGEHRIGFDDVVALLGIAPLLERRPQRLSGGEKQRVAIGRALLSQPLLMLMDEPLASLDAARKAELLPYIEQLRAHYQIPILYVSHSLDEVIQLADHLLLIDQGQTIRCGPLMETISDGEIGPYIGQFEAGSVIESQVLQHDDAMQLTTLGFAGGQLRVPRIGLAPGHRLRLRIRARDVSLAITEPSGLSISNALPGHVAGLLDLHGPYMDVSVKVGGVTVRALVTRESVERLQIRIGLPVWALVKTVAIDNRSATVGYSRRPGEVA